MANPTASARGTNRERETPLMKKEGTKTARMQSIASKEVQIPRLLAMLCILAVFVPSFFMSGVSRSLFVPLALALGFAMAASYLLSSTLVPVLSTWILRGGAGHEEKSSVSLLAKGGE